MKEYGVLNGIALTDTITTDCFLKDFQKATELNDYFRDRVRAAFGIGTYISNDTCVPALNIVMKVTECNGMDVAKISDVPGKGMCKNPEYVEYLQRCIDWRMNHE